MTGSSPSRISAKLRGYRAWKHKHDVCVVDQAASCVGSTRRTVWLDATVGQGPMDQACSHVERREMRILDGETSNDGLLPSIGSAD